MEKQTKNIINREWVEKELRFYNTADIRATLTLGGVLSLIFLPFTIGLIYGFCLFIENIVLKIVLSIIFGTIISAPIWSSLLQLINALVERKLLQRGEFDIVVREVIYKSDVIVQRRLREYLHFGDFKKREVKHVMFEFASIGDEFYLVHYKTKNTIKLLYPTKMYEYKN